MGQFLDFTKAENLPDGLTPDLLANESVQEFIKSHFEITFQKRFDTEASGLQQTNASLKEEKKTLKSHLDKFQEIDMDEYGRLQEFKKNNGDASKQLEVLQAEKEAIKESYEQKLVSQQQENQGTMASLHAEQLSNRTSQGIREHNAKFPTVSMKDGSERWVIEEAKNVWKRGEDGSYTPMNGDRVLTGDSGDVMSYPEWVNSLRKRAEFAPLFNAPSGGGAPGGGNGGGGGHFNPSDLAGTKAERTAAIAAKFNLPG